MSTDLPPLIVKKRYYDLDALRAFAMLLGVVLHGLISFMPDDIPWPGRDINPSVGYTYAMHAIHGFRMQLFFVVSGFFTMMMWKNRGLQGMFKHRFQRIGIPFVGFLFILYPLVIAVAIYGGIKTEGMTSKGLYQTEQATPLMLSEGAANVDSIEKEAGLELLGPVMNQLPGWAMIITLILCFAQSFHHLWFLYYLMWLVLMFGAAAWLAQKLKLKQVPAWFIASPLRLLWLIPITFVPQFFMTMSFGPDTASGFVPWPPKLLFYTVFFGFGALCFGRDEYEQKVGTWWPLSLLASIPAFIAALYWFDLRTEAYYSGMAFTSPEFLTPHILCTLFTVTYTWLMIFGLIGLFRVCFASEDKKIRYVSDSSYWLYLMHLPLIMYLQILVSDWQYPSIIKFAGICITTAAILLIIYEIMVRYTWIGTMLNGKKYRQKLPPTLTTSTQA
jgi:peptidoglycan/LPS O-acetylase OafA/YrhL